jgi:hypothetical protein
MTKGKRRHLVALVRGGALGLWSADYRWAKKRHNEVRRRFSRGEAYGCAWWIRVGYEVHLKPLRGQKR